MQLSSKLPNVGTTIFSVMSQLAQQYKAINLSQGFPNFDCATKLKEFAQTAINQGLNQYAPLGGLPILTENIATKVDFLYQKKVNPAKEITITSGATQAIFTAIQTFVRTNDEVILIEPAYDSYAPSVELCGGVVVPYTLKSPDFQVNWMDFAQLICERTRMIIINSPHNPTGAIFTKADWQALEKLVEPTNILVLSDEVYEHIVFDGATHESILKYPNLWKRTVATFSFGKTFHNTGWKIGYCIAPDNLMKEFRKVHQFTVFSVSTPMQFATAKYLENPDVYTGLSSFYQQKRDFFLNLIDQSRFKIIPSKGTYFQLADYSEISDLNDSDFAIEMTKKHGVAVIPVSAFCSTKSNDKIIRFCFAKTDETLINASQRLCKI